MRIDPFVALLAVACVTENELRYTSTLQAETSGVALSDDGLDGFAAMSGTTCTIDANWGCPVADEDLPTEEEVVEDHYAGQTLGRSAVGLHTIDRGIYKESLDVPELALKRARLSDVGAVMVHGDVRQCSVQRVGASAVTVPGTVCAEDVEVSIDRRDGTLYASTPDGVLRIDASGAESVAGAGDLISWDPLLHLLYTADSGTPDLRALRPNGSVAWEVQTAGDISDLHRRGSRGEVLVLTKVDELGRVERRRGEDGKLLGRSLLPDDGGDMVVSDNGRTIGFVREGEVHFFDLRTEGDEAPVVDETPPTCIDPENRVARD